MSLKSVARALPISPTRQRLSALANASSSGANSASSLPSSPAASVLSAAVVKIDRFGFARRDTSTASASLMGRSVAGGGAVARAKQHKMEQAKAKKRRARAVRDNLRLHKWMAMKEDWEEMIVRRPEMVDRRVRKGIPMPLRADIWCRISGAQNMANSTSNRHIFSSLQQTPSSMVPCEQLVLHESLRIYHGRYALGSERQRSLFRVLRGLSLHIPHVGYSTSIGYFCAFFLLFMDEQHTFWMLDILLKEYGMEHMFVDGVPKAMVTLQVLQNLVDIALPSLSVHLESYGIHVHMYAMEWVMTMFTKWPSIAVRLIDHFLHFRTFEFLYRIVLAMLQLSTRALLATSEFAGLMFQLCALPTALTNGEEHVERLMQHACKMKLPKDEELYRLEKAAAVSLFDEGEDSVVGDDSGNEEAAGGVDGDGEEEDIQPVEAREVENEGGEDVANVN